MPDLKKFIDQVEEIAVDLEEKEGLPPACSYSTCLARATWAIDYDTSEYEEPEKYDQYMESCDEHLGHVCLRGRTKLVRPLEKQT